MAERGLFASTFDEFAFIRGILKMQMTEQSPVSEHGAFRHGLHRDEYGEGIGGTGIASVEHIAGFAFQPLVVHMIEPIFMCCDGGAFTLKSMPDDPLLLPVRYAVRLPAL